MAGGVEVLEGPSPAGGGMTPGAAQLDRRSLGTAAQVAGSLSEFAR